MDASADHRGAVAAVAKPSSAGTDAPGRRADPEAAAAGGEGKSKSPVSVVGVISCGKSEGDRARDVIVPYPGVVIVPRSINDDAGGCVASGVARQVAAINQRRRRAVDIAISHGINRAGWRDSVNHRGNLAAQIPPAARGTAGVPDGVIAAVIGAAVLDHWDGAVVGVGEGRA